MPKFIKRPIPVEAKQWFPDPEYGQFVDGTVPNQIYINTKVGIDRLGVEYTVIQVGIRTRSGFHTIKPGDWIIAEIDGHGCYPCDKSVFESTYEPI